MNEDPIIILTRDPDLNKQKSKTNQLIRLINGFPPTERKVSKLCQTSFTILQNLEKISLNLKSWEFMSLDFNSDSHFENDDGNIKDFTQGIAVKILESCKELNYKLVKISHELDLVTRASRTLTPIEYMSDSGTVLTSLTLRNIKLKNRNTETLTVAHSKAKLIMIGKELSEMLGGNEDSTVLTYQSFISNLMKQLNNSIEMEDSESNSECLAVINDMEKMFEAFKLEKMREMALTKIEQDNASDEEDNIEEADQFIVVEKDRRGANQRDFLKPPYNKLHHSTHAETSDSDDIDDYDSDIGLNSFYSSSLSQPPQLHSITRSEHSVRGRRDSLSSMNSTPILAKTTLSDELPYLMTAFNSAKVFEEDVSHFKQEEHKKPTEKKTKKESTEETKQKEKHHFIHKSTLPDSLLYSSSNLLPQVKEKEASLNGSYMYSNDSFLSRMGIRPQVISTNLSRKELGVSHKENVGSPSKQKMNKSIKDKETDHKENKVIGIPLTQENLSVHNFTKLSTSPMFDDID